VILPSNLDKTLPVACNTAATDVLANVEFASTLPYPWLRHQDATGTPALLIGGGPSVSMFLETIRAEQKAGAAMFAMNGTRAMLERAGIVPDYFVLVDAQPGAAGFVGPADTYLIASTCNRAVFDKFGAADNVVVWHPNFPGLTDISCDRERVLIGGGSSVGILSMSIAYVLGFRDIRLFGFDSSYEGDCGHAYEQHQNDNDEPELYTVGNQTFAAAPWMARQAVEFQSASTQLADLGASISVLGRGLLPAVAAMMARAATNYPETTNASR